MQEHIYTKSISVVACEAATLLLKCEYEENAIDIAPLHGDKAGINLSTAYSTGSNDFIKLSWGA